MTPRDDIPELWGMREVKEYLMGQNVSSGHIEWYLSREDFPDPQDLLACGRVWLSTDVIEWAERVGWDS